MGALRSKYKPKAINITKLKQFLTKVEKKNNGSN